MVQSGASRKVKGFESLALELKSRNWDIVVDERNKAFITPFENDSEKWELEVHFTNESDYLVSSRSRWYLTENQVRMLGKTFDRLNDENSIGIFGSEIGINQNLRCFEVKTLAEIETEKALDSFFETIAENTDTYGRWSETVRDAAEHIVKLSEIKELEDRIVKTDWQNEELESRLKILTEAFLREVDEESAQRAD